MIPWNLIPWWGYLIIGAIVIAAFVLMYIYKRNTLKNWLLIAVEFAENELGEKRGQEKLELVHKKLVEQFPIVGRLIPFRVFSKLVDEALEIFEQQLTKKEEE